MTHTHQVIMSKEEYSYALAKAWNDGYEQAVDDYGCAIPFVPQKHRNNPYRRDEK